MDSTPTPAAPLPARPVDWAPLRAFQRVLHGWWLILLLTITGGLAGLLVHSLRPPVYDASAGITASLNFNETGSLTEQELDYALNSLGAVLSSDAVLDAVRQQAAPAGLEPGSYGFRPVLERRATRWVLKVRHPDPNLAAGLANLWAIEGYAQISAAYDQALLARSTQARLAALETCLTRAQVPALGSIPCAESDPAALQAEMSGLSAVLFNQLQGSRGLIAALIFDRSDQAQVPTLPSRYGLNTLILAGMLLGLLGGFLAVQSGLAESFRRRAQNA